MKPGKARKDRPKGPKSFSRSGSKRVDQINVMIEDLKKEMIEKVLKNR
jgi:hypothetical protein